MRTWINTGLTDYLRERYHSLQYIRVAIIPFDVPVTFAPSGSETHHFGRELARNFQAELARTGELSIIELFNFSNWPGKREDFFSGNFQSIQYARDAGYDLVVIGFMEDLQGADEIKILTKIIDVNNGITLWHGETTVYAREHAWAKALVDSRFFPQRPDIFSFPEKSEQFAVCTVDEILNAPPVP